ncbi:RNA-directed DNA polymerase, eukaryota, reverse transcriptase zinc-binding domain protein [Tanacetum coccineum]
MRKHVIYKVGDGSKIFLWHDRWWDPGPLINCIPMEVISQAGLDPKSKIKEIINDGQWKWPAEWINSFHNLPNSVPSLNDGSKDMYMWETNDRKCYNYSTNRVWKEWSNQDSKVDWCDIVWFSNYTSKHSFLVWMAVQGRLTTQEWLMKWYPEKQLSCSLCGTCPDSLNHVFFDCHYSSKVWRNLKKQLKLASLTVKRTSQTEEVCKIWKVDFNVKEGDILMEKY